MTKPLLMLGDPARNDSWWKRAHPYRAGRLFVVSPELTPGSNRHDSKLLCAEGLQAVMGDDFDESKDLYIRRVTGADSE